MKNQMALFCGLVLLFLLMISHNVNAQGIEIKDARVSIDYDEAYTYRLEHKDRLASESDLRNGSTIRAEILPGSNVTFTFWIANTFSGTGNEIRSIVPKVTIEELDDGADVDFEGDEIKLEGSEEERVDIKFFIPLDSDGVTYNVLIEAEGERNGTSYEAQMNLKMPVRKQSHDIRIIDSFANPAVLQCSRKASCRSMSQVWMD